ncbi:carboxyl transferase domain-containing protein [Nocardioides currus]|uniref:Acetyl-CoA carboxyl transferase n=1 Tax=Nocardioides currus TaxID=2133958 RepID=A0A2R7YYW7_9ACTN|nr:carboxyl transferase domain-containing protein [Nocardioides currus]PUA81226.1 acetyl-CoA carboxyl transferase [Nocardioides currus]
MSAAVAGEGPRRWGAEELLDLVLDEGTWQSWDRPIDISGHDPAYQRELVAARERAGTDESVITGRGLVRGRPVAVIANEFRFLAGSIGRDAAGRITAAVRRATAEGLPLLATTASGGTRMQEGTPAFVEMVEITRAIGAHRAAGLAYLVHLRNPTTGGVYASWGSLGHVTVAEPGALVGFLGPKVFEALHGEPFPSGVQRAENLAAKGVIDAVVAAEQLPELVDRSLRVLLDPPTPPSLPRRDPTALVARGAWESVELTRSPDRAGVRDLLRYGAADTLRLRGTDEGERDETIIVALTRLDGQPCVLVGQDRSRQGPGRAMGPAALREARRAMNLAEELRLPLVTVIDTPGAELSVAAEERAVAGEIARCIATMTRMRVPTLAVLLGQGCGGGALALLPARRVLAAQHAWLSPLPPEGASVIVHGDVAHAAEMAERHQVRAVDLAATGTVHRIVPEREDDDAATLARAVAAEAAAMLVSMGRDQLGRS